MPWRWCAVIVRGPTGSSTRRRTGWRICWPARASGPGGLVALLFSRSAEAVVAMLAVLKAGAAYLPIDPALPAARLEFMLADAAPVAAITTGDLRSRLDGHGVPVIDVADPRIAAQPRHGVLPTRAR